MPTPPLSLTLALVLSFRGFRGVAFRGLRVEHGAIGEDRRVSNELAEAEAVVLVNNDLGLKWLFTWPGCVVQGPFSHLLNISRGCSASLKLLSASVIIFS